MKREKKQNNPTQSNWPKQKKTLITKPGQSRGKTSPVQLPFMKSRKEMDLMPAAQTGHW